MISKLPNEILLEVFSYMNIQQVYKMGTVCRSWQLQRDLAIFAVIRNQAKLHICPSIKLNKANMINLELSSFDSSTDMLEFKPSPPSGNNDNPFFDVTIQGLRMVYSGWPHDIQPTYQKSLTPVERAQYAFHHEYNPIHQKLYFLPSSSNDSSGGVQQRLQQRFWVGDLSMGALILLERDFTSHQSVRVVLARVSIPWILSGYPGPGPIFTKTDPLKQRLKLNILGPDSRFVISNARSGTILENDDDNNTRTIITQQPEDTAIGRWQRLNEALIIRSLDPLLIWKYHFIQLYLLGKSDEDFFDIISKIYNGEREWLIMKPKIMQALSHNKEQQSSPIRESLRNRLRNIFNYN